MYNASATNENYLILNSELDRLIRPTFKFADRCITINESDTNIVDDVLHYRFKLEFIDSLEENNEYPYMGTLEIERRR